MQEIIDSETGECFPCPEFTRSNGDGDGCEHEICKSKRYKIEIDGTCERCPPYTIVEPDNTALRDVPTKEC